MKERSLFEEDYIKGVSWEDLERDAEEADRRYVADKENRLLGQPGEDVNSFRGDNIPECRHKHDILDPKARLRFYDLVKELLNEQKP